MATNAVNELAQMIRRIDGNNQMAPVDLGAHLATRLIPFHSELYAADLMAFVERTNPDKRMGAGRLAELIVAEFNLDKEQP